MISLSVIGRFLSSVNTQLNTEKIEHDVLVISGIRFTFFKDQKRLSVYVLGSQAAFSLCFQGQNCRFMTSEEGYYRRILSNIVGIFI
jgi:hypothetical protein